MRDILDETKRKEMKDQFVEDIQQKKTLTVVNKIDLQEHGNFSLLSLFFVLCSLFFVLCSLFFVLCSLFFVLCSLFFVLCSSSLQLSISFFNFRNQPFNDVGRQDFPYFLCIKKGYSRVVTIFDTTAGPPWTWNSATSSPVKDLGPNEQKELK